MLKSPAKNVTLKLINRAFNKQWDSDSLLTENNGKPRCLMCLKIAGPRRVQHEP
jgi:hypothetical protein